MLVEPTTVAQLGATVGHIGIEKANMGPRRPGQNPDAKRVIGSIRRDALDLVIVLNERLLRLVLRSYMTDYHTWRALRSLDMDAPKPRLVQPQKLGAVRKRPKVGGLHHLYERMRRKSDLRSA